MPAICLKLKKKNVCSVAPTRIYTNKQLNQLVFKWSTPCVVLQHSPSWSRTHHHLSMIMTINLIDLISICTESGRTSFCCINLIASPIHFRSVHIMPVENLVFMHDQIRLSIWNETIENISDRIHHAPRAIFNQWKILVTSFGIRQMIVFLIFHGYLFLIVHLNGDQTCTACGFFVILTMIIASIAARSLIHIRVILMVKMFLIALNQICVVGDFSQILWIKLMC